MVPLKGTTFYERAKTMSDKSNSKSTKKGSTFNRYRKNRPIDVVNTAFLIFMTSVFSLYMHNKYFDITGTRADLFMNVGLVYVILAVMAFFLEIMMIRYYEHDAKLFYKDSKVIAMPELWMGLFLLANFFGGIMTDNKKGSWDCSTGRRFLL